MSNYCSNVENKFHNEQPDSETLSLLNKCLTKTCKHVLRIIYEQRKIQQKDLCHLMNTTTSNLSNLISRIEAITPALLIVEKSGRAKYYSLTPIAHTYVKQELLGNDFSKVRAFSSTIYSDDLLQKAQHSLHDFKQRAGNDWDIILDNLLSGKENSFSPLSQSFSNLMDDMKKMKICNQENSINKLYELLNQNILKKRIEQYLKESLADYFQLKPLFDLEQRNQQAAFELIDAIFENININNININNINNNLSFQISPNSSFVDPKTYYELYNGINKLIQKAVAKKYYTKTDVMEFWQKSLYTTNIILFYIAEKYISSLNIS